MKKIFTLSLFFTLLVSIGFTQPAFNSVPVPAFGTKVTMYTETNNTIDPGPSGANKVWDFSAVTFSGTKTTSEMVTPASTGYQSSFPSANVAEKTQAGNYMFINMTTTSQTLHGMRDNAQGVTIVYNDPLKVLQLPISYGSSQTDDYSTSLVINSIPTTMNGNIKTEYDGYGTLKTVNGTYNNIVRFKATKTDISSFNYGAYTMTVTTTSVSYAWYIPGSSNSIFAIMDLTVEYDGETMQSQRTVMMADPSTITDNKDLYLKNLSIAVGPNPTSDKVTIQYNDLFSDDFTTYIINERGEVLYTESNYYNTGDVQTTDISNLSQGIYFIRVTSSRGSAVEKIVKK